jgi:hypothetical protein
LSKSKHSHNEYASKDTVKKVTIDLEKIIKNISELIKTKANLNHEHEEYAFKKDLENIKKQIPREVNLKEYATLRDLRKKVESNHKHSEYATTNELEKLINEVDSRLDKNKVPEHILKEWDSVKAAALDSPRIRHRHKASDIDGLNEVQVDLSDLVEKSGSVMTGDLEFPATGFIMNDGTSRWRVTIDTDGNLVTTMINDNAGQIIGFPFGVTYAS